MPYIGQKPLDSVTVKDIDGQRFVLDADADTSFHADTDDQIDIEISGADDFRFTANTFTALSGSTIAAQALTATTGVFSSTVSSNGFNPDAADGAALGSASLEFSDLYLADSGVVYFGNDQDVTVTHDPDDGLFLKSTATADNNPFVLTLQTGETDIAQDDIIGQIDFQAPDEGTGTDAILVAGSIRVVSEGDFSSSNNATSLNFFTGKSAAAGTDGGSLILGSTGNLTLKDLATADGSSPTLTLQTGDTDIAVNDILGKISFQAPDEGTGTDAILVSAAIQARAEGDHSSSSNATSLDFMTGASEAAAKKMSVTSGGDINVLTGGASVFFGADSEIELRHVADDGLILKHVGTGDGKEPSLTFQAGDNDIAANDVLGSIFFQAPDEGAGTDAVLVAAGIEAVSEGDFSSSNNATKLSFKTGASEAAAEKMSLSSAGNLTVSGDLTISGDDLTMGTNTSGAALIADGTNFNPVVISGDISIATNGTAAIGSGVIVEADIANDAVTLAKMASGTDGNIISYDASGNPVAIATGNDGQVLTSTGAGSPPAFEDAAGGGLIFIQTVVASGDSTITLSGIDATYDSYFIAYSDVDSGTNSAHFRVRFGDSGGIDSGGSDYSWGILQKKTDSTTVTGRNDENDDHIELMDSTGADGTEGVSGLMKLHAPGDASHNIKATFDTAADLGDGFYGNWTVGRRNTNIAITQVQFYFDSTTVSTGRFTLWGLKHS